MTKRMLIDAGHREETRVAVADGRELHEFDVESALRSQLKGNIYLAKVTRVEPSLQAAFVEYGGNRHGFLAFSEIHPDYFQIPVSDREKLAAEQARLVEEAQKQDEEDEDEDDGPDDDHEDEAGSQDEDDGDSDDDAGSGDDEEITAASDEDEQESSDEDNTDEEAEPDADESDADETDADETDEGASDASDDETDEDKASASTEAPSRPRSKRRRRSRRGASDDGEEHAEAAMHAAILKRGYRIQEVIKRRQILLIQVVKEERGNKGAALTTFMSIAGRYCVLMPNTPRGGGISRKIADAKQRRRLKDVAKGLEVPEGMGLIIRTAGQGRTKLEIKRDFNSLLKQWEEIREHTLVSSAPSLIYEEANIIKRAIRDLYAKDIDEILVEGDDGYKMAKSYMKLLMPSHAARVQQYKETTPLFHRYDVERQLDAMHSPVVQLKSGGYIVINPTEALVAIDVNSGRSTKERNIEETATKTNIEAAVEIARQLRLRDLAGLIVIDFIDMDDHRNDRNVERKVKDAVKTDRARIQIGRISSFGLMELSRQRLRPSFSEALSEPCPQCGGLGHVRSTESTALHVLRGIEDEAIKGRAAAMRVLVPTVISLYLLNQKRQALLDLEERHGISVLVERNDDLIAPEFKIEIVTARERSGDEPEVTEEAPRQRDDTGSERSESEEEGGSKRRKRRRRPRRGRGDDAASRNTENSDDADNEQESSGESEEKAERTGGDTDEDGNRKRRRRGRRGGRRRRGRDDNAEGEENAEGNVEEGSAQEETSPSDNASQANEPEAPAVSEESSEEEAPKPRRRRTKAKSDEADKPAETAPDESDVKPREPAAAEASEPATAAPGVKTTVIAADNPEQPGEAPKAASPKRGWWQKIVNPS